MKNRLFESPLFVLLGLAALLVLLVGLNVVAARLPWRLDLTEERAFTLSDGTRRILSNLKSPVQARFYYSQSDEAMPMGLKNYAQAVNDLLDAMETASGGKLQVQRLDPTPDSDAEDSARLDGVDPQVFPNGDRIYLGLGFSQLDRKSALPFLAPDRERLLEYDIARALNAVSLFTADGNTAREFARRVQIGMVGINVPIPVPMAFYSFGGWKKSLFGDTHAYGMEGVRFYTRYKAVMQRWPGSIAKGAEFVMPTAK